VRVCMCVLEREALGERERGREGEKERESMGSSIRKAREVCFCACLYV